MKFNNRPNWFIKDDKKIYWISRSVTVLPILLFVISSSGKDSVFVPLGKRGKELPDEIGKWGLPGGYLDWDETASEAVLRETYEEMGLNLLAIRDTCLQFKGNIDQPYWVSSNPTGKQNITLRFPLMFWVESLPELSPKVTQEEVEEAKWFDLETALKTDLAFGHQNIIRDCLNHYFAWKI